MLRFAAPHSRGRVIAWSLLLATAAALGLTRWMNASDHKDSALLAADHAADIADLYTFRSPTNPDNLVLVMTVSGFIPQAEASTTIFATRGGIKVFAGVRDDPFFFDLAQFKKIVAGMATRFNNPGTDAFAGTNVLAIVIELPSSMLGATRLGVWGSTSRQEF